jgi:hypothetical protein
MKISFLLTIIGWVLFLLSIYLRSNHAEKVFGFPGNIKRVAFGVKVSSLFCFLLSILISLVFTNINVTI